MATAAIVGAKAHVARERTRSILEAHAKPEHLDIFENLTANEATSRFPEHRDAFVAATVNALAEIVQAQAQRLEEQEARLTKLEEAAAAPKKAAKK